LEFNPISQSYIAHSVTLDRNFYNDEFFNMCYYLADFQDDLVAATCVTLRSAVLACRRWFKCTANPK